MEVDIGLADQVTATKQGGIERGFASAVKGVKHAQAGAEIVNCHAIALAQRQVNRQSLQGFCQRVLTDIGTGLSDQPVQLLERQHIHMTVQAQDTIKTIIGRIGAVEQMTVRRVIDRTRYWMPQRGAYIPVQWFYRLIATNPTVDITSAINLG